MTTISATSVRERAHLGSDNVRTAAKDKSAAKGGNPLDGRVHVFGKPISKGALFGMAAGGALTGGMPMLLGLRGGGWSPQAIALRTAGAAVVGGLVGAALSTFMPGPKVGHTSGQNNVFVKTGTEAYSTTCTSTFTSDGKTHTHTYPCTQIRDVGYHEWRDATGEMRLGRHQGAKDGYATLEAAKEAVSGNVLYVERDGKYHVYGLDAPGLDRVTRNYTHIAREGVSR